MFDLDSARLVKAPAHERTVVFSQKKAALGPQATAADLAARPAGRDVPHVYLDATLDSRL